MEAAILSPGVRVLPTHDGVYSWVLCRADYSKGVFIPVAPLPPKPAIVKKERSDIQPKTEVYEVDMGETIPTTLSVAPGSPDTVPGLVINSSTAPWSLTEDNQLRRLVKACGPSQWEKVAAELNSALYSDHEVREGDECSARWKELRLTPVPAVQKGRWKPDEEARLLQLWLDTSGHWEQISSDIGRSAKAVRARWEKLVKDTRVKTGLVNTPQRELVQKMLEAGLNGGR